MAKYDAIFEGRLPRALFHREHARKYTVETNTAVWDISVQFAEKLHLLKKWCLGPDRR